ncbi:uncharacterized protein METZ01_LOCUS413458, partial [marine metagenome]
QKLNLKKRSQRKKLRKRQHQKLNLKKRSQRKN